METDYSGSKQCQFCRFRRTFFIFKIPALALFTQKKEIMDENNDQQQNVGMKFREIIQQLWNPMLDFLCGKIANVEYKYQVQTTEIRHRLSKQNYMYQQLSMNEFVKMKIGVRVSDELSCNTTCLQNQHLECQSLQNPYLQVQPLQIQQLQTQSSPIQSLQTRHLNTDVVDSIQRVASSLLFQPEFKLVETYCENLKTKDEYYIYFNNVHPSIYKKSCVFDDPSFETLGTLRNIQVRNFFKGGLSTLGSFNLAPFSMHFCPFHTMIFLENYAPASSCALGSQNFSVRIDVFGQNTRFLGP